MNSTETKMVDILTDLKENHHVISIKTEFEAEGAKPEEVLKLKEIASLAGLGLTIKIGGCEALKDMYDARTIGAQTLVAPMIESPYAAKKYLKTVKEVFTKEERNSMNFLINIETKYGFQYIEEILESDVAKDLTGIVLGRTDLTGSLDMDCEHVNSDIILDYARTLAKYTTKYKKIFVIGGGVSAASLPFFKSLPAKALNCYETRKVVFDAQRALADNNAAEGIVKAIGFELLWIKNKPGIDISPKDIERLEILKSRCKDYDKAITNT